jgi:hypothetical protein
VTRPRWILDLDPEFPAAERVARRLPDPIIVSRTKAGSYDWPAIDGPVVLYGTMRMVTRALREPGLANRVFDHYPALRCSSYYRAIYDLLGRTSVIVPFTALHVVDWRRMFGDQVFVRPDSNYKLFAARVVAVDAIHELVSAEQLHRDELVVVSEVVELGPEYRCFCRGGRVVCHSAYPGEPYTPAPPDAIAFAEQAAARLGDVLGSAMMTIDVALGRDRPRLVEAGGVNSWGLYGCDVDAFIAAMEDEARARHDELTI